MERYGAFGHAWPLRRAVVASPARGYSRGMRTRLLLLLALVSVDIGCKREPPEVTEARAGAKEIDTEMETDIQGDSSAEARAWLGRSNAVGWKVSVNDMRKMTDEIYGAGATKVWVVGISTMEDRQMAAVMAIELPSSEPARKKVFDWYATWASSAEEKPAVDVGQRFLKVVLD